MEISLDLFRNRAKQAELHACFPYFGRSLLMKIGQLDF